jgi:superoxide dismutase
MNTKQLLPELPHEPDAPEAYILRETLDHPHRKLPLRAHDAWERACHPDYRKRRVDHLKAFWSKGNRNLATGRWMA